MSFAYPRTITINRPPAQTGKGAVGYGGATLAAETQVVSGLRANIQLRREGQRSTVGLPGDGNQPTHDVRIPRRACARGTIKALDVVIDDLGQRYQVLSPYWDSLGYALRVLELQT